MCVSAGVEVRQSVWVCGCVGGFGSRICVCGSLVCKWVLKSDPCLLCGCLCLTGACHVVVDKATRGENKHNTPISKSILGHQISVANAPNYTHTVPTYMRGGSDHATCRLRGRPYQTRSCGTNKRNAPHALRLRRRALASERRTSPSSIQTKRLHRRRSPHEDVPAAIPKSRSTREICCSDAVGANNVEDAAVTMACNRNEKPILFMGYANSGEMDVSFPDPPGAPRQLAQHIEAAREDLITTVHSQRQIFQMQWTSSDGRSGCDASWRKFACSSPSSKH